MANLEYFVANPNALVRKRLQEAGIPATDRIKYQEGNYEGAWVSQKFARKLYDANVQNGCITCPNQNIAFDLFYRSGGKQTDFPVQHLEPASQAAMLGTRKPKQSEKTSGRSIQQDFGRLSTVFA